jgi:hypothetical protein
MDRFEVELAKAEGKGKRKAYGFVLGIALFLGLPAWFGPQILSPPTVEERLVGTWTRQTPGGTVYLTFAASSGGLFEKVTAHGKPVRYPMSWAVVDERLVFDPHTKSARSYSFLFQDRNGRETLVVERDDGSDVYYRQRGALALR